MPGFATACFDLDGTIADTEPIHLEAERSALAKLDVGELAVDHPETFGMGIAPGMEALAQRYGFESGQTVLDVYEPIWRNLAATSTKPMTGAARVVRKLNVLGVPMALVTSGNRSYAHGVLDAFGMREMFACTVTENDVSELKPSPEPYLLAAKALGVAPSECVGFEDSPAGITSLAAAGMYSIAIGSGTNEDQADLHVNSLVEITDTVLARLFPSPST